MGAPGEGERGRRREPDSLESPEARSLHRCLTVPSSGGSRREGRSCWRAAEGQTFTRKYEESPGAAPAWGRCWTGTFWPEGSWEPALSVWSQSTATPAMQLLSQTAAWAPSLVVISSLHPVTRPERRQPPAWATVLPGTSTSCHQGSGLRPIIPWPTSTILHQAGRPSLL